MNQFSKFTIASLVGVFCALPALSEPKPRGSKPADPQAIMQHYLGKTWDWTEGASYWGSAGSFQATWKGRSIADGKWYVTTRGTMCYDAVWKYRADDGSVGTDPIKNCWKHVVSKDGQIWQRSHDEENWYPLNADKVSVGNRLKAEHKRIAAKLK